MEGAGPEIRLKTSLAAGFPFTMGALPFLGAVESSGRSKRSPALRAAESGPWQGKQFSARIGRTSLLYRSFLACCGAAAAKMARETVGIRARLAIEGRRIIFGIVVIL